MTEEVQLKRRRTTSKRSKKRSKQSKPKRTRKGGYRFYLGALASILLLATAVFFIWPYIFGSSQAQVQKANSQVQSLYYDATQVYLSDNISAETLKGVEKTVNSIKGPAKEPLVQKLNRAKQKYALLEDLQTIYANDGFVLVGNTVSDDLILKPDVTKETIASLMEKADSVTSDEFSYKVKELYTKSQEILDSIATLSQEVGKLPQSMDEDESLLSAIASFKQLESKALLAKHQPQFAQGESTLQEYAKRIAKAITARHSEGILDENLRDKALASQYVAQALEGTALDNRPLVALTFDDGPNLEITPQVLDILKKHDVKGTFFVMGAYVDDHPDMARRIVAEGHQIANHTYTHPDLAQETDERVLQEITWTQESIRDETGVTPTIYRLPFGSGGERVVNLLKPLTSIIWNVDSEDWKSQDAPTIVEQVLSTLQHQTILLMHDTHQASADALDQLIPILKEKGYQFVMPQDIDYEFHYY